MNKVLCIGDICADIIIPYGLAKNNQSANVEVNSGGTTANSASGLAKLNVPVSFIGIVGNDYYGQLLTNDLKNDGVDIRDIKTINKPSTQILVVQEENKDRFNFLFPKENPTHLQLTNDDIEQIDLNEYSYLLTSGLMLFEQPAAASIVSLLKKAKSKGIKVCLDINYRIETASLDTSYLLEAIKYTDYLFASSKDELIPLSKIDDIDLSAKYFVNDNRCVIARLAEKGANIYANNYYNHQDSFKIDLVDTLGAGDSYNCGFIYGLVNNYPLDKCNKLGCACAAINISKVGARNCPNQQQLLDFLANNN